MEIEVKRIFKGKDYTIGKMYLNGEYFCDTLEDTVRDLKVVKKIYGETAIPEGRYRVEMTYSPKFKRILPLLLKVPFFEGIRIHSGNSADDSLGCLLVGENKVKGKVINSRKTEDKLTDILRKEKEIWITIK